MSESKADPVASRDIKLDEPKFTPQNSTVVRAKMVCNRMVIEDYGSAKYHKVHLGAVYGKEGENAGFAKATPSGECWLQIDADMPAAEWFKPNKRYYLTFTEAPD
jgi:hypothetical protein